MGFDLVTAVGRWIVARGDDYPRTASVLEGRPADSRSRGHRIGQDYSYPGGREVTRAVFRELCSKETGVMPDDHGWLVSIRIMQPASGGLRDPADIFKSEGIGNDRTPSVRAELYRITRHRISPD